MKRKSLAILLVIAMLIGTLPVSLAANNDTSTATGTLHDAVVIQMQVGYV